MNCPRIPRQIIGLSLLTVILVGCGGTPVEPVTTPAAVPPTQPSAPSDPTPTDADSVSQLVESITWLRSTNPYGHTAIKIETNGQVIYLDPVDLVDIESLPKADLILITHDHGDHFSPRTVAALAKESTEVVSIEKITRTFDDLPAFSLVPGDKVQVQGLEIEGIPAYNAHHPKTSDYLGFVFSIDGVRIYCSGDTDLQPEIEALSGIDVAVLNVRKPYCLTGEEVVEFAEIVKPAVIIPIHWMPDDDTYGDMQEIEYIQQNMPETTRFVILELSPPGE
jgi:L-ascorbate metabolism protein UlaG (beta-lactamase superfamily)